MLIRFSLYALSNSKTMSEVSENTLIILHGSISRHDEIQQVVTKLLSELSSSQTNWLLLTHTTPNQVTCASNK